jgi:rSAM/selenodomain-associated transferase 1
MSNKKIVIVFCKHPEPGMVKSRLAADLGDERAANIYKTLLNNTILNITQNKQNINSEIFLYCYPNIHHPMLSELATNYSLELKKQSAGTLGDKMHHAINTYISDENHVVLIGSDCLMINKHYIENAFNALASGNDIVLGPSRDGGYALIGAKRIDTSIFENVRWSTNQVLKQTTFKLQKLGWKYSCLSEVRDIDHLDDYQYFSSHPHYRDVFN